MKNKKTMLSNYMKDSNRVAVDFDGTLCLDGKTICNKALKYIPKIANTGVELVLWTCRCDDRLQFAIDLINKYNLPIKTLDDNDIKPRKISSIYSIDDRSVPGGKINWYLTYRYIRKEMKRIKGGVV